LKQLLTAHYLDIRVVTILLITIRTEGRVYNLFEIIKIFEGAIQAGNQVLNITTTFQRVDFHSQAWFEARDEHLCLR